MNEFDATLEKTPGFFDKIQESIKKNPMLFIAGAVGMVIFVVAIMPRRQEDMVFDNQQFPVGSPTTPGGVGSEFDDTELRELLEESIVGDRDMMILMDQILTGQQQFVGEQQGAASMLEEMMASMAATQPIDKPTVEYNLVVPQGVVSIDPVRPASTTPAAPVRAPEQHAPIRVAPPIQPILPRGAVIPPPIQPILPRGAVIPPPIQPVLPRPAPVATPAAAVAPLDRAVVGDGRRATVAQPVSTIQFPGTTLRAPAAPPTPRSTFPHGSVARAIDIGIQNIAQRPQPGIVQAVTQAREQRAIVDQVRRDIAVTTPETIRERARQTQILPDPRGLGIAPLATPAAGDGRRGLAIPATSVFVTGVTGRAPAAQKVTTPTPRATTTAHRPIINNVTVWDD